jgi:branched-chain amino acid transport system substrate-binding protein
VSIKRSHRRILVLVGTMTVLPLATGYGVAEAGHRVASGATTEPGGSAASEPTGEPIVIGYAAAVTGGLAPYDSPDGVQCEAENINAAGGILGRPVEVLVRDMQSDPALAATVGQELLDAGSVVILAPPTDDTSIPIAQLALPENVAVLSVEATQPAFPIAAPDNGYLVYYGDNYSAAAVAEFAYGEGHRTAVILTSPDLGSYAILNPQWFGEAFEELGGSVVGTEDWSLGVGEFGSQITDISAIDPLPDLIYMAAPVPDAAQFVRQLRAAGLDIPVYGGDGFDDPDFVEVAGAEAAEGVTFSAAGFPGEGTPLRAWIDDCNERGFEIRNTGNAAAGDAMRVVKAAIEAADSTEPADINAAMQDLENVEGVLTPSISYAGNEINMPTRPLSIVRITDGEPQLVTEMVPEFVPEPTG